MPCRSLSSPAFPQSLQSAWCSPSKHGIILAVKYCTDTFCDGQPSGGMTNRRILGNGLMNKHIKFAPGLVLLGPSTGTLHAAESVRVFPWRINALLILLNSTTLMLIFSWLDLRGCGGPPLGPLERQPRDLTCPFTQAYSCEFFSSSNLECETSHGAIKPGCTCPEMMGRRGPGSSNDTDR